eukprot:scaffold1650_cov252-Chaetoceros_neogracile.AAC.7
MGYGYSIAMTILGINRMYSKWRAKNLATARTRLQMKLQGSGEYYANSEEVGDVYFVLRANSHSMVPTVESVLETFCIMFQSRKSIAALPICIRKKYFYHQVPKQKITNTRLCRNWHKDKNSNRV